MEATNEKQPKTKNMNICDEPQQMTQPHDLRQNVESHTTPIKHSETRNRQAQDRQAQELERKVRQFQKPKQGRVTLSLNTNQQIKTCGKQRNEGSGFLSKSQIRKHNRKSAKPTAENQQNQNT